MLTLLQTQLWLQTNDDGLLSFQEFHAMIEQWTKALPTLPATSTEPETTPAMQEAAILRALSSVSQVCLAPLESGFLSLSLPL